MTTLWITDDNLGSLSTEDPDYDPGAGWHTGTLAEYQAVIDAIPSPVHDDVHAFLDGAGITDPGARDALHRLFEVGH